MTAGSPGGAGALALRVGACLSLCGRYARFGRQAAAALDVWRTWDEAADLTIEDDRSDPRELAAALERLAAKCDILLGPYSTHLMRTAGDVAGSIDCLIWNHGGSGDDVETAHPGHVVSVLTPTSRYADPFVRHLARDPEPGRLWLVHGRGGFGRQVVVGAEASARVLGIETVRLGPNDALPTGDGWHLFSAGSFEEDVQTVRRARQAPRPPRTVCAVAAGVREFGDAVDDAEGIYGVGQWFPGGGHPVELGPAEADFLAAFLRHVGSLPDYPAAQAAATAVIAAHCARLAGGTAREPLWAAASALETTTFFGAFKIDPRTGAQVGHEATLTRWTQNGPTGALFA